MTSMTCPYYGACFKVLTTCRLGIPDPRSCALLPQRGFELRVSWERQGAVQRSGIHSPPSCAPKDKSTPKLRKPWVPKALNAKPQTLHPNTPNPTQRVPVICRRPPASPPDCGQPPPYAPLAGLGIRVSRVFSFFVSGFLAGISPLY